MTDPLADDLQEPAAGTTPTGLDPVASLRCWSVVVALGGRRWTIPALPAADWLEPLFAADLIPDDIFPAMVGDPQAVRWLDEALLAGDITLEQATEAAMEALTVAAGRPWWVTVRLAAFVAKSWDHIGGQLAITGPDAATCPLGRWLDAAYLTCVRSMKPDSVDRWMAYLNTPPIGVNAALDEDEESAAFLAAMKQV